VRRPGRGPAFFTELLKKYLKMSHVRRYYAAERQAVSDAYCAGNPAALKAIRDESNKKWPPSLL
jgi:hypothetical protein